MKITLISPYPDITAYGIRTISSFLKQHGHAVQLIFLPDPFGDNLEGVETRYDEALLDQTVELCRESQLIGITLMTNFFDGAVEITAKLKAKLATPVIWGGVHPTIRREECLEQADMICIGEGEDALLELMDRMAAGKSYSDLANIWCKADGKIVENPLRPLPQDLDIYPHPDYSMEDHHVAVGDKVVPLTHAITEDFLAKGTVSEYLGKTGYQTMTSRGCPYSCTYCINDTIKQMYGGKGKLRWRSVAKVIDEFVQVKKNMPYVNYFWLSDDEFLARKQEELEDFCRQYKEKINLPFSILISAISVNEKKMSLMVDAGLIYVQMGVESASVKMQKLFNRKHINNERMMAAIKIINKYKDIMFPPSYDFLMDVPGETDQDRVESLKFISEIPKPFKLQPFTLITYPGTHLYEVAKAQGLTKDERKEIYNKTYTMRVPTFLNLLMALAKGGKLPSPILKFFIWSPVLTICNSSAMKPVFKLIYNGLQGLNNFFKK